MSCPNSTVGGCRCPEHDPGLSVHAVDAAAYAAALDRARGPVRLSIVTLGPSAEQPCTGAMTCPCPRCSATTAARVQRGAQGAGNASPFKVRKAA